MADQDKSKEELITEVLELRREVAALSDSLSNVHSEDDDHNAYHALKMEAVGRLAGGIAHDFNNILTAVQGNAELLKMDGFAQDDRDDMLEQILQASKRASGLTRQLLDFARKGTFQIIPVDTNKVIDRTVTLLSHTVDKRIEIKLDTQADPPAVLADPSQIENAIVNLGMNACDAMPHGGELTFATKNVVLDAEACEALRGQLTPGPYVEICVCDTGSGMDVETQSRIFEPFFTTKEVGEGTGLGLASVYGCIESHYGSIQVDSEPGRGTTFKLLLHAAETACDSGPPQTPQNGAGGSGHILVVDDEGIVREFVSTALHKLGYSVSLCVNGAEAVEYFHANHENIDLVILDLVMPVLNGPDTFARLREINPDAKVLISSGFTGNKTSDDLCGQGALGFLSKPFRISELAQMVAQHVV